MYACVLGAFDANNDEYHNIPIVVFRGALLILLCYTTHQVFLTKPRVGGTNRQLPSTCRYL